MNPGRYFMPNMANPMMMSNAYGLTNGARGLGRLIQGVKSFDWGKLLNGAGKTLNVVNQTIPIIKQAKPVVNNVKKMVKIVRALGNETNATHTTNSVNNKDNYVVKEKETDNSNYPNFFI